MKKEYIHPRLKVVQVKTHKMLCGSYSFNSINEDTPEEDGIDVD